MTEKKIVHVQVIDRSTRWNDDFQRQDASIRKTKKNKTLNDELTDAEKRKRRTDRKRA